MKKIVHSEALPIGLAMFSMFFGAGNIIFPLVLGQYAGDKNFFAVLGMILTAALMPIIGVLAMILFDGSYKNFFGRLGKAPGFILALIIISLLGPLGSTPRCIALSYTALTSSFVNLSPTLFSAASCAIIFLFSIRRNQLLSLLGWVLTPLLLVSLTAIILIGLFTPSEVHHVEASKTAVFLHGLKEGYNTMDLLAAFFFSSTILTILKMRSQGSEDKNYLSIAWRASLLGAVLLAAVYIGFSYLASFHGNHLDIAGQEALLGAIILKIAGAKAGFLVCVTIALACLTTAIALICSFADFFQKEVLQEKVSYPYVLLGALILTFCVSTFEFSGISAFLAPILEITYPGLIVLTFLNIAYRIKEFKPIKAPVCIVFALSFLAYKLF